MEDILIPISICVVLPVMIVWLVSRRRQNETNRKTEIMLKIIESGASIDTNLFMEQQKNKTIKERLLKPLAGGCIFLLTGIAVLLVNIGNSTDCGRNLVLPGAISAAIGLALLIVFFIGHKMLTKEMEAERKALEEK